MTSYHVEVLLCSTYLRLSVVAKPMHGWFVAIERRLGWYGAPAELPRFSEIRAIARRRSRAGWHDGWLGHAFRRIDAADLVKVRPSLAALSDDQIGYV